MKDRDLKVVCYGFRGWCGKPVDHIAQPYDPSRLCHECRGKRELQQRALAPPYGNWFAAEERATR